MPKGPKKLPEHIEANICGARVKNPKNKAHKYCQRKPMPNGRCHIHGGKSTGPKSSLAYYKRQITQEGVDIDSAAVENPLDLEGELAFVRTLLVRMQDDPLQCYCGICRQWVYVQATCPNEEYDDKGREHPVYPRNNDFSKTVQATKHLSDIAKAWKEIVKGKEITLRVEVLNIIVERIISAHEAANRIKDPDERTRVFVSGVQQLLIEQPTEPSLTGKPRATKDR